MGIEIPNSFTMWPNLDTIRVLFMLFEIVTELGCIPKRISTKKVPAFFRSSSGLRVVVNDELFNEISSMVMDRDNIAHTQVLDIEEVYQTLLSMPSSVAVGPDGFSINFHLAAWEIIKEDLVALVKYFFVGGMMHRSVSASIICLIPKVDNPVNFSQYCPISVGNVAAKLCSKIINNRILSLLPSLISVEQAGFVKGRDIFEHVQLV